VSWEDGEEGVTFRVVINREEQYSILAEYEDNPPGWDDEGKTGTKHECLQYILEVWTDMRPLSLRRKMDEMFGKSKVN
jgi:MbtH protein